MKTTEYAVGYVHGILTGLNAVDVPVYAWAKPTQSKETEYIVINSLPISAGVLQRTRVNVNYYTQDIFEGVPNMAKLQPMTAALMELLEEISETGIMIDFETQEYIREKAGMHYSNIRLFIKIIN